MNFHFVQVNALSQVENDGHVYVNLSFLACAEMDFQIVRADYADDTHYDWYGRIEDTANTCAMSSLTILGLGSEYAGHLSANERSFELFDLTGGIRLICETDLSSMNEISRCGAISQELPEAPEPPAQTYGACEKIILRVLVLHTAAADAAMPNTNSIASTAISQINSAFANSAINGVGTQVVLAGVEPLTFTETLDAEDDIDLLVANQNAQSLRSAYNADVVILLTDGNYSGILGIAANFGTDFNRSYAIVQANVATTNFLVFAHEFGHLLGARHQHLADPTGVYQHAHSFLAKWKIRNTIMRSVVSNNTILHYSNPNVSFMNHPTGTSTRNNARKIREMAPSVAAFFVEASGLTVGSISFDDANVDECEGGNLKVAAIGDCGLAPYTYVWYYSSNAINWNYGGNGQNATVPVYAALANGGTKTTFIKVIVSDLAGNTVTQTTTYTTYCEPNPCPGCPQRTKKPENKVTISPNPSDRDIRIDIHLLENEFIHAEILDVQGRKIKDLCNEQLFQGINSFVIVGNENLASGIYTLKVQGITYHQTQKFVMVK